MKALLAGVITVVCLSLLPACGGSDTPTTPGPPTNGGTSPPPQGVQVENSTLSIVGITRLVIFDFGSGNTTNHPYSVPPGSRGAVIPLQVGNYNLTVEYVVASIFQFINMGGFGVTSNNVTLLTVILT